MLKYLHVLGGLEAVVLVCCCFFFNFFFVCVPFGFYLFIYFKFYFIFKLYNIVLVLPNIEMNPPQVYMCSPS